MLSTSSELLTARGHQRCAELLTGAQAWSTLILYWNFSTIGPYGGGICMTAVIETNSLVKDSGSVRALDGLDLTVQ